MLPPLSVGSLGENLISCRFGLLNLEAAEVGESLAGLFAFGPARNNFMVKIDSFNYVPKSVLSETTIFYLLLGEP